MNIIAFTDSPNQLIKEINEFIELEKLKTWGIVQNNKKEDLYTHTPEQWNEKAMFKATLNKDSVSFDIKWWKKNGDPGEEIKGYILGRFIELLMVNFIDRFQYIRIEK